MRNTFLVSRTSLIPLVAVGVLLYGNLRLAPSAASSLESKSPTVSAPSLSGGSNRDVARAKDSAGVECLPASNRETHESGNLVAAATYTLTGRIVRKDNPNVGIPNVMVDAANRQGSASQHSTRTDNNGNFTLRLRSDLTSLAMCGGTAQTFVVTPVTSGASGFVFDPSFRAVSMSSQGNLNFTGVAKPSGANPSQPDFRLPFPLGDVRQAGGVDWKVTTEVGGYCGGDLGSDSCHTNLGSGFYALDFGGSAGIPILAAADGQVVEVGNGGGWGFYVLIRHDYNYYTRYAHLPKTPFVTKGPVSRGQVIGLMGSSGVSTGVHLHFQIYHSGSAVTNSQSATPALRGIKVQSTPLVNYTAGSKHKSTNPGPFTVVFPNGGDRLVQGSAQRINWKYSGSISGLGSTVKIELLKGGAVHSTIRQGVSVGINGSGSYNWTVPKLPAGSDYRVRIVSTSSNYLSDSSDRDFVISVGSQLAALADEDRKQGTALIPVGDDDGKKIPLILVHGIHGSDNTPLITQLNDYWSAFISKFNGDSTLKKSYALYVFQYYSDSEIVPDIASHLGSWIDQKLRDRKHVLLAHSMGGLVAKSYMTSYRHGAGTWAGTSGGDSTRLLVTLATPHHGSPGANDAAAIKQYMGTGWYSLFSVFNFVYWKQDSSYLSPQPTALNSGVPNRSDLRWDNYDNAIAAGVDVNLWLWPANRRFVDYKEKIIAYGGALKPTKDSLSAAGALARLPGLRKANDHKKLDFANDSLLFGLSRKFGITDGMVPYYSSLLCDPGPFIGPPDNDFICLGPLRVRRFEPGPQGEVQIDDKTMSITRKPRGYDHLDMLQDSDVLNWVVKDLSIGPKVVVSTSLQISPAKGPYSIGQNIPGTFSVTNRGTTELDTRQVLIAGRVGNTCPNRVCPDFTIRDHIKLAPGQTYNYSGSLTPSMAGTYTFSVAYQTPDEKWVIPVDTEKGTINKLEIVVAPPPPTLARSTPSSLAASPNAQTVNLYGTGLSRILYCWVQFPNGKGTYIYIPLSQVRGRSDTQLETTIKFATRGTYYISAFTMDKGRSNALPIVVH